MCVSTSLYSDYTSVHSSARRAASRRKLFRVRKTLRKSPKKSMKTSEFRVLKPYSRLPSNSFVSNRQHPLTLIDENRIVARAFKIEISKAHSIASKSRL